MKLNHSQQKAWITSRSLLKTFACDFNPKGRSRVVVWGCQTECGERSGERLRGLPGRQLAAYKGLLVLP